jgi:hypothetical protein
MAAWRRMFLLAHVWLTAFMTLLAGLPHLRCQCSTEYAKPVLPIGPCQVSKCCDADSYCTSSTEDADRSDDSSTEILAKRRCCCCQSSAAQLTDKDNPHGKLKSLGCKRTLTEADPALLSVQEPVNSDLVAGMLTSDSASPFRDLSRQAGFSLPPWQSHAEPPPTDLVLTLQHFNI